MALELGEASDEGRRMAGALAAMARDLALKVTHDVREQAAVAGKLGMDAAQRILDQGETGRGLGQHGHLGKLGREPLQQVDGGIGAIAGQQGVEHILDASGRAAAPGGVHGAAQDILELDRAARRLALARQRDGALVDDQGGALVAQACGADGALLEDADGGFDAGEGVDEMGEADLAGPIGQRQVEGVVAAGQQRLVDP